MCVVGGLGGGVEEGGERNAAGKSADSGGEGDRLFDGLECSHRAEQGVVNKSHNLHSYFGVNRSLPSLRSVPLANYRALNHNHLKN